MTMEQRPETGEDDQQPAAGALEQATAALLDLTGRLQAQDPDQWQRLKLAAETLTQLAAAAEGVQRVADARRRAANRELSGPAKGLVAAADWLLDLNPDLRDEAAADKRRQRLDAAARRVDGVLGRLR